MSSDIMNGSVDPETIYTKQNCIGKSVPRSKEAQADIGSGGGSFGKVYKGYYLSTPLSRLI
jgi:hypothetical protein